MASGSRPTEAQSGLFSLSPVDVIDATMTLAEVQSFPRYDFNGRNVSANWCGWDEQDAVCHWGSWAESLFLLTLPVLAPFILITGFALACGCNPHQKVYRASPDQSGSRGAPFAGYSRLSVNCARAGLVVLLAAAVVGAIPTLIGNDLLSDGRAALINLQLAVASQLEADMRATS